ncbi:Hypothetical predicted protein [Drosophila guanche]|uniref:Uncharacterized protein n=1 Tax=Drosophila guanche TaxID=7266 RepID=A0A3B0K685_DROGU|nr:Hypothetical predicted protein [Drosophila guanche]
MDRQGHSYRSDSRKQEEEMPQQGKSVLPEKIRQILNPTSLQTLECPKKKPPERQHQPISIMDQISGLKTNQRSALMQRIYQKAELHPLQTHYQQEHEENHPQEYKNYESASHQQKHRYPGRYQIVPQHQSGKPPQDLLKQQQYRVPEYPENMREPLHQPPHDDQTRKNTQKEQNHQTVYQNPPKKDQYIDLAQKPLQDQWKEQPPQKYRMPAYENSTKKPSHGIPQDMGKPPQMPSDDHKNASKMIQENLQPNDPCDGPSPNVRLEQLKQQPPQEYRESSYENSSKKSSHGNAQNIREPPHQPHNDHKNASKMMEQNLQKNSSYEELPRKLANDQLKHQPRQQYRMSGYEQPSQQPHDDQTRKNTQKMMQPCQQMEYQNPTKTDEYVDPPQMKMEYKNSPKMDLNDQFKEQTPIMDRVLMPHDDYKNAPKMMLKHLPKQDPCEQLPQKAPNDQLKQQPPQEYRESAYENSAKKSSHGNAQNIREPPHQPHNDHKNASKMMEQNLQKNSSYEELPRKLANDQLKQQPPQEYRESAYENSAKKSSHGNAQNIREPPHQPHNDNKNASKMMEQNLQKNSSYEELPRKLANDQLKHQPRQQYRMSGYEQPSQQPHDDQTRKNTQKMMQPCQQTEYQNPPKKDQYINLSQNVQQPPQMPSDDHNNASKMMQENLQPNDPCDGPSPNVRLEQLKQQPQQEYRESSYENSAKKSSHGNAQNIREPPHQPHNDHKNASKMMEQNLQKNSSYEELPRKLANDQLKHQPRQQYRMSGYEQPSQQPHDDQTRKNTQKMMQPCQQMEYQNPTKTDEYVDPPQMKMEYKNSPKMDLNDQFKEQTPIMDRVLMPHDDYKNAPKMMLKHLPKQDPCEQLPQKAPNDQLKQQPPQEYRESAYENSAKKSSHGNAQNIREPPHQPHNDHKNASKMMEQNLQKNSSYEELPRKLANDQLKQQPRQQYRMSGYEQPSQQPHDDQTRKNTQKMMQPCQQTEYQNPPKKDQYINLSQNVQQPPQMPSDDHNNASKMMQENLQPNDPCDGPSPNVRLEQLKQQPQQEYRESSYENSAKKSSHGNAQNIREPPHQPHNDHKNASKMMEQNLQKNSSYEELPRKLANDQLKQQPRQQYRMSGYEQPSQQPHDDQTRKNTQKMMQPCQQMEYQNPTKTDEYVDPPQMKMEYKNSPKMDLNDQFKEQTPIMDRVLMPHDDYKNAPKMMLKHLPKQDPCEQLPQKAPNDQLKQQPPQEYRESAYENSAKKSSHGNAQNIREPPHQPHNDHKNASKMMEQNLQKNSSSKMMQPCQQMEYQNPTKTDEYVDPPQMKMEYKNSPKMDLNDQFKEQTPIMDRVLMPHDDYKNAPKMMLKHLPKQDPCEQLPQKAPNDQLKQQPPQEYRESAYENSAKKSSHGNAQNIREPPHQPHNDHKNASKMMEQNLQKNSSYEELPRKLANDQLKQQPRQQFRMSGYEQPSQQPHDDQTRKNTQKMMQQNHQTEYQNPPKKDQYINLAQNVQQPPQMPSDDHNNASKMMQENLQPNDPCDGPSPNVRLEQLKQQPPQEYRESSYENSAKKSSHGNAQNIREPPHHPHNDHKNASKMMEQNLQKNSSYEELPRKLANDQLKQQPRQQYRMSGYEQPSQQPHDDQTRKNNVKMMQPCQQTEYQNPTKTDEYVDPPQKKMEYKNSPKTDPNDQFKEQTPLLYRVLMPHDDYKNAPKMMVKHLPKQCPCEQLPEKAPNDQLKQHPLQEYRVPGHQCFTKNLSHEKSHHMVQKNQLTDYQDPPPKFPVDHLKQQPTQEYQESVYHNYAKKTYHGNPQNMRQHSQQQPYDQQTRMNSPSMMQEGQQTKHQNLHKMDPFEGAPSQASQRNPLKQNPEEHWEPTYLNYDKNPQQIVKNSPKESHNHPKKNPLEGCLPRSPHDQLKKQPPEEYRVSSQVTSDHFKHRAPEVYQNSTQKPSHGFAQDIKQPSQQPFDVPTRKTAPKLLQAEYQKAAKKDSFEAPIQKTPNDHLKQQPPREHLESSYCNSAKQQLHSNLQKQPFSNATQEHAESSSSRIKTPHSRNCTKATVAPVPRARSSSRLVQQQLFTNADDCQPSHIADKAEVRCSPKCCEKHSSKMACKHEYLSTESTSTASTVISVKNADELRSLVSNELELQAVIMELSNDSKKEGILNPKQCTHDKTYKSKKMWENAYTRARADLDKVQQVDYSHTVDNIVSESVISPMIRQIQRMYIRNLRDEMALVESLELVPLLVKEVCENVDNMDQNKL